MFVLGVGIAVIAVTGLIGLQYVTYSEPDEVQHIGATEGFAEELHALQDSEVSSELVSAVEDELRWGELWHQFSLRMQDEIDRVLGPYLPVPDCGNFAELRELVGVV